MDSIEGRSSRENCFYSGELLTLTGCCLESAATGDSNSSLLLQLMEKGTGWLSHRQVNQPLCVLVTSHLVKVQEHSLIRNQLQLLFTSSLEFPRLLHRTQATAQPTTGLIKGEKDTVLILFHLQQGPSGRPNCITWLFNGRSFHLSSLILIFCL